MIEKSRKFAPVKEDNFQSLIEFATLVQNLATTMKSLKTRNHLCNPQLLKDLIGKLPASWKTEWCRHLNRSLIEDPTVGDLATWLKSEAASLSAIYTPNFASSSEKVRDKDDHPRVKRKDSVLTVVPEKPAKESRPAKNCEFCGKSNHKIDNCFQFKKLELGKKRKFVMDNEICFGCLVKGHQIKLCSNSKVCGVDDCTGHHHQLLHSTKQPPPTPEQGAPAAEPKKVKASIDKFTGHTFLQSDNRILYKILPVILKGPKGSLQTHALLDEASAFTLLDSSVADTLGIHGPCEPLLVRGVSDSSAMEEESETVELQITGKQSKSTFNLTGVRTKKNLGLSSQSFKGTDALSNWKPNNINLESMKNAVPTILIGLDNIDLIATEKLIRGPKKSLVLGKTKLGWTIYGNISGNEANGFALHIQGSSLDEEIHQLVKQHFLLEADGIKVKPKLRSREDERAIQLMESRTKHVGQSWETALLWKADDVKMPPSRNAAFKRLLSVEKKMDGDSAFANLYEEKIQYYVDNGYAKYLTSDEGRSMCCEKEWFLPHFGVVNPNKPGKIRVVFDAAAKVNGTSLNDNLLTGPDLLPSLPGCLIRFRQKQIGFSGDIKDFFPRIKIRKEDQQFQKFFWRGMDRNRDPDVLVMAVNMFGAVCAPFTSQSAKNKNAEEFGEEFPAAAKAIVENHYMDDWLDSADSTEEAVQLIRDVIEVHSLGDMKIEKFCCSERDVLRQIPKELRANGEIDLDLGTQLNTERILGMYWDPNSDQFQYNLKFHKVDPETNQATGAQGRHVDL